MSRSLWKVPYIANNFLKKKKRKNISSRSSEITYQNLHKGFHIHNGKNFIKLHTGNKLFLNYKFGSFALTKKDFVYKKKKKKK